MKLDKKETKSSHPFLKDTNLFNFFNIYYISLALNVTFALEMSLLKKIITSYMWYGIFMKFLSCPLRLQKKTLEISKHTEHHFPLKQIQVLIKGDTDLFFVVCSKAK